jgi:hypothetical protein
MERIGHIYDKLSLQYREQLDQYFDKTAEASLLAAGFTTEQIESITHVLIAVTGICTDFQCEFIQQVLKELSDARTDYHI